jgi:Vault protein inter-alpha-trypsin domain/von Willebrand factor type A domain
LAVSADALAASADRNPSWRVLEAGEQLPPNSIVRTSAADWRHVALENATLGVGPDTRLRLDTSSHRVALFSGELAIRLGDGAGWTIEAQSSTLGGVSIRCSPKSTLGLTLTDKDAFVLSVLESNANVLVDAGARATVVAQGFKATLESKGQQLKSTRLSSAERRDLEAHISTRASLGLGQLMVRDSQAGSPKRLDIARYHVNVVLQPPVALVQVDQSFYNPNGRQEEGEFVFNLPSGASVSRFAMYVTPTDLIEGELVERQRASQIYETIVRSRRDPAILEQIGDNLFKMRVFPVPANDTKRILLDYTVPLDVVAGRCTFQLPLTSDLAPIWDFAVTGVIGPPVASARCLTHSELRMHPRDDGAITFALTAQNYQPRANLSIAFEQEFGGAAGLRSYRADPLPQILQTVGGIRGTLPPDPWSSRSATYFLASIDRARPEATDAKPAPADVLILADSSSGMGNLVDVRKATRTIIHALRAEDRVRLACVDVGARPLGDGWLAAHRNGSGQLLAGLEREFVLGGTDLETSLTEALRLFDTSPSSRRRMVIYLGDGADTLSHRTPKELRSILADRMGDFRMPLFSVVLRRDPAGRNLLESLADASGGAVFDLVGGDGGGKDFFSWLLAGMPLPERIVNITADGVANEDLEYSRAWFPDRTLHISGRAAKADQLHLTLNTIRDGQPHIEHFDLHADPGQDDVFVGRLWAQKRLDRLLRQSIRPAAQTTAETMTVDPGMLALAQQWSLLTPHTAFLVLESEQDYVRWGVDRQQRRRYWNPPDAIPPAPLPLEWLAQITAQRQTADEARRFDEGLSAARKALAAGDADTAYRLLQQVRRLPAAARSATYAEMSRDAMNKIERRTHLESLGAARTLVEPARLTGRVEGDPSIWNLLTMFSAGDALVSPEFLARRPLTVRWLQDVEARPGGIGLSDIVSLLSQRTGANVQVDRRALADEAIDEGKKWSFQVWGRMSLRNYVGHALAQQRLVALSEPHRILITTRTEADGKQSTDVYPIADLLLTERVADLGLLSDPIHDRDAAARQRIVERMRKPMTVDFDKTPLKDVAEYFAAFLQGSVVLDERALSDEAIAADTPVSAAWKNVPARESLRWLLDQLNLRYQIRDEAIVITSKTEADAHQTVRLHSARGVLYEYPVRDDNTAPWFGGRGGFGFGGGMLGGSGFGMGGGMFGGSGGFAAGGGTFGGGGGFSGGLGGAGFGGGGFGGAGLGGGRFGGAMPGQAAISGDVGLSSGGEIATPSSLPQTDVSLPSRNPVETETDVRSIAPPMARSDALSTDPPKLPQYSPDVGSVVSTVTTTIAPDAWDDNGGPGSVAFFAPTLDFVISATDEVHDDIDRLFEKLRNTPAADGGKTGRRLAQVQRFGPEDTSNANMSSPINLITSCVSPWVWDDNGGPCSISPDYPRLALIVSADQPTHDAVWSLLTDLRRSRFASLRSGRPWNASGVGESMPLVGSLGPIAIEKQANAATVPLADSDELRVLSVRREPGDGAWKWRVLDSEDHPIEPIHLMHSGARWQADVYGQRVRVEGNKAAFAYPDFLVVERGPWGPSVLDALDSALPWMPHRSNEDIARRFDVSMLPSTPTEEQQRLTRIRLAIPSAPRAYVDATFSRAHGQPTAWAAYVDGKKTLELEFSDVTESDGPAINRRVRLVDGRGRTLRRWELMEAQNGGTHIAGLGKAWKDYARIDRRANAPGKRDELTRALRAMHDLEWREAHTAIDAALRKRPEHPLPWLMKAWCWQRQADSTARQEVVAALRHVAAGHAPGLVRFIGKESFPALSAVDLYDVLDLQPINTRSPADWERLGHLAAELGRIDEGISHLQAANKHPTDDGRRFARDSYQIELLLRARHCARARDLATRCATRSEVSTEDLATLADIFAVNEVPDAAHDLYQQALRDPKLPRELRSDLLLRNAAVRKGLARWRLMLTAMSFLPAGSTLRAATLRTLCDELTQPEHAAQLAFETSDPSVQSGLLVRQAELTADAVAAAEVIDPLVEDNRMPPDRSVWAAILFNQVHRPQRAIALLEAQLRAGASSPTERLILEEAYQAAGRERDVRRAKTCDPTLVQ